MDVDGRFAKVPSLASLPRLLSPFLSSFPEFKTSGSGRRREIIRRGAGRSGEHLRISVRERERRRREMVAADLTGPKGERDEEKKNGRKRGNLSVCLG